MTPIVIIFVVVIMHVTNGVLQINAATVQQLLLLSISLLLSFLQEHELK